MPLFSEHIANMYYGSPSSYSGSPYSYSSSVSPIGSSYSASYLNPGGNYSNHSSLGGYSRAPLSSRWITSSGRNYSPMLSTISERGSASPIRINSPRRLPRSTRTYGTSNYIPRPVNINTADIDVSKDRYRHKVEPPSSSLPHPPLHIPLKESSSEENTPSPFMPRVDGITETSNDSSPGAERSTIKRGRTVVRLYTIKRRERDSPRKPIENQQSSNDQEVVETIGENSKSDEKEFMKWREKLSEDLVYKEKKEKKSLGAKLVEKFILKDNNDNESLPPDKQNTYRDDSEISPSTSENVTNLPSSKSLDRRCSMELMAEQANLFDSLIRSENLSTATLDLSKVGTVQTDNKHKILESLKNLKSDTQYNPIKTTKSDYSLHESLKSYQDIKNPKSISKRRSIKRSSSGSSIRRLDSITEFPKESCNINLPAIEESLSLLNKENTKQKPKTKLKQKITGSVEVSTCKSPLKFIVEQVTVEEKPCSPKKEIVYSSEVEEVSIPCASTSTKVSETQKSVRQTSKGDIETELPSPEPENGNFWDKIGKRETIYLKKRKQNLDEVKEKYKRSMFWFPEEEDELTNKLIDEDNNKKEFADSNISRFEISEPETHVNVSTEKLDTCNNNVEVGKKSTITPILDEIQPENNVISELKSLPVKNNISIEPIKTDFCQEKKNISKSASLKTLDENKELQNKKKTKSEKHKKVVKTPKDSEKVPIKHIDSQDHNQNEAAVNLIQKIQKDESNLFLLENKIGTIHKTSKIISTDSVKKKARCPLHPQDLQEVKQVNVDQCKKTEISCIVHPQKLTAIYDCITDNNNFSQKVDSDITTVTMSINIDGSKESCGQFTNNKVSTLYENKEVTIFTENKNIKTSNNLSSPVIDNDNKASEQNLLTSPNTSCLSEGFSIVNTNNATPTNSSEETSPDSQSLKSKEPIKINHNILSDVNLKTNIANSTNERKIPDLGLAQKDSLLKNEELSESSTETTTADVSILPKSTACENSVMDSSSKTTLADPDNLVVIKSQDIPDSNTKSTTNAIVLNIETLREENKAESINKTDETVSPQKEIASPPTVQPLKKPIKEEKAVRPLIATPRPLQKKPPQVIHSSDSSDTSSDEESSEDDDDSDSSESSGKFYECENNPDGRTSTGSNDSGFDSSAPASPATFSQIKKDCDVNCHRKCEKLTANLCGVNQRLLVEALASRTASKKGGESSATTSSAAPAPTDILEQELEQSTAYDIFRKTGRFTPPARSIPRFRKYTVEDFQFIKVLGKGSFGKVLLAELRDTEYYYAVKCLKKDVVLEDDDVECTLIERKVLALGTNHPYLCHLFATFQTDSHLFFVMEYLNGGDLMFHIQQSGRFPEARARFYAAEIVSGLKFLHKRGIVYRDLKLDNILLDYEGHVRIADFGMCKLQIYLDKTADTFCGTPDYMAPEIIKGLKYNQTVDWWSFGVLLYEMLIGQSPFSGCDEDELFWSICNEMPSYPRFLSQESLTILTRLLDKDARTRLGGTECMHGEIRDQDFFHQIHWDRLERRELEAPFRPRVRHPMDTQYFDRAFTGERPRLTAVEPQVLRSMDQEPFRGFSYTNPNTTDR